MNKKFAVLAVLPEQKNTQVVIVQADDALSALTAAAQSLMDEGETTAQLVAVFTSEDLSRIQDQLSS